MKQDRLTSVFIRISDKLRASARRIVDDSDVDDVLQESFVKLWSRRTEYADDDKIEGTAVVTVRNTSLDALRRQAVRRHDDIDTDPRAGAITDESYERSDAAEMFDEVSRLIESSLSARDREILYLRERDGWEFEDIAARFDIPAANVRVIVSRSRKTIRELYRNRR